MSSTTAPEAPARDVLPPVDDAHRFFSELDLVETFIAGARLAGRDTLPEIGGLSYPDHLQFLLQAKGFEVHQVPFQGGRMMVSTGTALQISWRTPDASSDQ